MDYGSRQISSTKDAGYPCRLFGGGACARQDKKGRGRSLWQSRIAGQAYYDVDRLADDDQSFR